MQNVQLWPTKGLLNDNLYTFSDDLLQRGFSRWNDGICALVFRLYVWAWIIDFLIENAFWNFGGFTPWRVQSNTDVIGGLEVLEFTFFQLSASLCNVRA